MYFLEEGHFARSEARAAEECLMPLAKPYLSSAVSKEWLHGFLDYLSYRQSRLIENCPRIKPAALSITKGWKREGEPDSYMLHIGCYCIHARPIKADLLLFKKPEEE